MVLWWLLVLVHSFQAFVGITFQISLQMPLLLISLHKKKCSQPNPSDMWYYQTFLVLNITELSTIDS